MKYYGNYNSEGEYIGFYNEEIHGSNIPSPNIELTEEQWKEALSSRCKVVEGVHTLIPFTQEELNEKKYAILRANRDQMLNESDWTQMPDSPLTDAQKQLWAAYRQDLRDLPGTVDINNIVYPEKP